MKMMKVKFVGISQNLGDAGYEIYDQADIYEQSLKDVYNNPRWYLDNLDSLKSFRVAWKDYKTKSCTVPYRFTKKYVEQ
jgi:outer membrane usher protein FimD/PapC